MELTSADKYTQLLTEKGVNTWKEALHYIKELPYGRNSDRGNFSAVITNGCGTCSSKHALLKIIADSNAIPNVELVLGMYRMNAQNTPGIGSVLEQHGLEFIPEAHCYLKLNGERLDVTLPHSAIEKLAGDILEEKVIAPAFVIEDKVQYHRAFLETWLDKEGKQFTLYELWAIREMCIQGLELLSPP